MNAAAEKIKMLKASLECFVCGLLSLLPVIGLPFGLAALVISGKVRVGQKKHWNVARSYWICGIVCATIGLVFWSFILMFFIFHMVNHSNNYNGGYDE
jgi:hypothetical protein